MTDKISNEDFTRIKSSQNFPNELLFKIIIIGSTSVGKTSLKNKITTQVFTDDVGPTIGFELSTLLYKVSDGTYIRLQLWDTCSQEKYRSLIRNFYTSANLAIICYAVNNYDSFHDISNWINEVKLNCNPYISIFLVECKCDLEDYRQVPMDEIDRVVKTYEIDHFFQTSAKTGLNTDLVFLEVVKNLYSTYKYNFVKDAVSFII